jgi:poly(A) polymerase
MAQPADKATALWVVRRLREAGFRALFAGGCVRDMLLGRRVADYDVASDATPPQVAGLFRRVLLVGAKFGVAMVVRRGRTVEVATFRSDVSYSDGRRPDAVRFSSPRQDALRRDFTINGMFYDPVAEEVIDYVGGRRDLRRRVVRTIGSPDERFSEDYLRMLRAPRFAVRLGFKIDPATRRAIETHAHRIVAISGERVFDELTKMLSEPTAGAAVDRLSELGLLRHVLPELGEAPALERAARERIRRVAARRDLTLVLGALLMDQPPRAIRGIVRRWGASNDLRDALLWLAVRRDGWRRAGEMPLAEFRKLVGHAQFERLRTLWRCRERAETGSTRCARRVAGRLREIPGGTALPEAFLTGADLLAMGVPEGPRLGRLLREAYDEQLNLRLRSRRAALAWVRGRIETK